jgi:hypothetical protein
MLSEEDVAHYIHAQVEGSGQSSPKIFAAAQVWLLNTLFEEVSDLPNRTERMAYVRSVMEEHERILPHTIRIGLPLPELCRFFGDEAKSLKRYFSRAIDLLREISVKRESLVEAEDHERITAMQQLIPQLQEYRDLVDSQAQQTGHAVSNITILDQLIDIHMQLIGITLGARARQMVSARYDVLFDVIIAYMPSSRARGAN